MKKACDGSAPGLGVMGACKNLSGIYQRGNKKFNISKDPELVKEYDHKAFLMTPEGQRSISMTNMPASGNLIS